MRLIPRRKRTWLLVLLGVAIVGAAVIWWAASEKSDFEKLYEQIRVGMMSREVGDLVDSGPFPNRPNFIGMEGDPYVRFWTNDGEQINLDFKDNRLIGKSFIPLDARGRLRRLWTHCFKSRPPF
jgi:hypothetical protein